MDSFQVRINIVFTALDTNANAFGKRHGINIPTLYNLANGDRLPSFETLEELCRAEPKISAEYLIRGEGKPLRNTEVPSTTIVAQLRRLQNEMNRLFEGRIVELED